MQLQSAVAHQRACTVYIQGGLEMTAMAAVAAVDIAVCEVADVNLNVLLFKR